MNNIFAVFGAISCNAVAQLLMKSNATQSQTSSLIQTFFAFKTFAAILAYGLSFLFMMIALKGNQLSILAPVAGGLTFIIICFGSALFFDEPITLSKMTGIFLLTLGIFFISR